MTDYLVDDQQVAIIADAKVIVDDPSVSEMLAAAKTEHETREFSANVKAPLVVNRKTGAANQVILENENLSVEYPLSEGLI